ncbi:MAG: SIMPL domain-containing protein [Anaerolineales bacterium]
MNRKLILPMLLLVFVLAVSACAPAGGGAAQPRTLAVTGTGTVAVAPDIAYINIGVHTEEDLATQAVASNNAQTQQVIDALKEAGIDEKDIRTSNFSIYTLTRYGMNGETLGTYYAVDNTVYVTVRNLSSLGNTLDAVVRAGANSINSIQFDVQDKSGPLAEARALAMKAARAQAEELAAAAGVTLGDVQSVSYYESYPAPVYDYAGRGGGGADASMAVPIAPGQYQITANVSLTYFIK